MARTKKELKDQDPLLGSETADQTAGAGADGTGLVPISVKIIVTTGEKYGILAAWKS